MATSCSVSPTTISCLPTMLWETRLQWGIGAANSPSCGTKRIRKGPSPLRAEAALGKKRRVSCSPPNIPDNAAHLRQMVVDQLKVRVEKAQQLQLHATTPPNAENLAPSPEVARILERRLYNRAASFDEHVNLDALDQRLSELCAALIKRLHQRKRQQHSQKALSPSVAPPTSDSSETQEEDVSGSEKYQRLESLIRQARAVKFSWSQHQSCCCGGGGGDPGPLPYKLEFPTPVKQFYFKTRVLQMERPPDENPADWDDIIREAETNIAQYQAWVVENLQKKSFGSCRAC